MSVGAVDLFGPGILTLATTGDRVLIEAVRPAYLALIRLDSAGTVVAATASGTGQVQGPHWLLIPNPPEASTRGELEAGNCPRVRGQCTLPGGTVEAPLRRREMLLLVIADRPLDGAELADRVRLLPRRLPPAQLPAAIMGDREGLWAAYLAVR